MKRVKGGILLILTLSHFSDRQNTENPVPRFFFALEPHGNACYAGYNKKIKKI